MSKIIKPKLDEAVDMIFEEKLLNTQLGLKATKDLNNDFGGYKYRSCESILTAVKPLLESYGLLLTISDKMIEVAGRAYVEAISTITDGDKSLSVSAHAREAISKKGMDDAQVTGSTGSYARKYSLNGLLDIDDNEDMDTEQYQKTQRRADEAIKKLELQMQDSFRDIVKEIEAGLDSGKKLTDSDMSYFKIANQNTCDNKFPATEREQEVYSRLINIKNALV